MNIWRTVMTKEFEDRGTTYSIHENVNIGEVKVADEVVAIIAGLAAVWWNRQGYGPEEY